MVSDFRFIVKIPLKLNLFYIPFGVNEINYQNIIVIFVLFLSLLRAVDIKIVSASDKLQY